MWQVWDPLNLVEILETAGPLLDHQYLRKLSTMPIDLHNVPVPTNNIPSDFTRRLRFFLWPQFGQTNGWSEGVNLES